MLGSDINLLTCFGVNSKNNEVQQIDDLLILRSSLKII